MKKKLLDSDWLRAVQFKCVTPVQKFNTSTNFACVNLIETDFLSYG